MFMRKHSSEYLILYSTEETKSYRFETTWRQVIDGRITFFGWTVSFLNSLVQFCVCVVTFVLCCFCPLFYIEQVLSTLNCSHVICVCYSTPTAAWRDSSSKHAVINYSPSCCSKPVRTLFIFGTQIKIFGCNPRAFWPCIEINRTEMFPDPEM